MPTVQALIDSLPYHLQKRYGSAQIYRWVNQGLRELQLKGISVSIRKETGIEVDDDIWITKPTGCMRAIEVYHPHDADAIFPFEEIEGKIKLVDRTFDKEDSPTTISAFSLPTTSSITINVTGLEENQLTNGLLVIDTGTYATKTYVISGNDISGVTTTKIYLLHHLAAALTAPQALTGHIVDDYSYLMLKYDDSYTTVTATTDEIAVDDAYEDCLVAFVNWRAHWRVQSISDETIQWEKEWKRITGLVDENRLRVNRKQAQIGRPLTGLRQNPTSRYTYTHTSD